LNLDFFDIYEKIDISLLEIINEEIEKKQEEEKRAKMKSM
jgi:hypothetical protein